MFSLGLIGLFFSLCNTKLHLVHFFSFSHHIKFRPVLPHFYRISPVIDSIFLSTFCLVRKNKKGLMVFIYYCPWLQIEHPKRFQKTFHFFCREKVSLTTLYIFSQSAPNPSCCRTSATLKSSMSIHQSYFENPNKPD